jgi:hypothetical protein
MYLSSGVVAGQALPSAPPERSSLLPQGPGKSADLRSAGDLLGHSVGSCRICCPAVPAAPTPGRWRFGINAIRVRLVREGSFPSLALEYNISAYERAPRWLWRLARVEFRLGAHRKAARDDRASHALRYGLCPHRCKLTLNFNLGDVESFPALSCPGAVARWAVASR